MHKEVLAEIQTAISLLKDVCGRASLMGVCLLKVSIEEWVALFDDQDPEAY
jgi:hypothetical protein